MFKNIFINHYKAVKALVTRNLVIECDRIPYQFERVPLKKILNWICVEASVLITPGRPWGWPTHLQVEPSTHCNLRCALCPVTEGMNRHKGYMDIDLFKKIIDEIGDYVFLILLWDWGEPFLNPSIYEMISYAKQKGIKLVSSTNGHPFTQAENADKLVRSGLDSLIVAMDGLSQETYERYRQGGKLESVLKGIRTIVERKRALNYKTPLINLRFIVMKHNEHEIPKLKDLARSLEVDALTFKTLNPCLNDTYFEKGSLKDESVNELLPKNNNYRRFKYSHNGQTRIRLKQNPCKSLWNCPTIHWNGTVCPCTNDYNEKYMLGNLKTDTFKNVWFGIPYRRTRKQFRKDWEKISFCNECSYAYKGGNCGREAIADAFFFNPKGPDKVKHLVYID